MNEYMAYIITGISVVFNLVSLVVILFLVPKSNTIKEIFKIVHNLELRMLSEKDLDEKMDLKIFKHMAKCTAHTEHNTPCIHEDKK